jgi:hypothetical protein
MSDDLPGAFGDKRLVHGLFLALKSFSKIRDDTVPLGMVLTFLAVAMDEGQCASDYAHALDVYRYSMARYIHGLGDRDRKGRPGLGLIRIVPDKSRRNNRHSIFLTAKGRAIAVELLRNLRSPQTSEAA